MKIIDMHAHTTNTALSRFHTTDASVAHLERLAEKYGIWKIVLMATYFPFKMSGIPNATVQSRIQGKKLFSMFASLNMMADIDAGLAELEMLLANGLVSGIKLYPGYQDFSLASNQAFRVYKLASTYDAPVAIHAGELHHCCPRNEIAEGRLRCKRKSCPLDSLQRLARPAEIRYAARACPEVNFIMSHLGNPYFSELRDVMTEYPNVYTDLSGQFVSGSAEDTQEYKKEIIGEIRKFLQVPDGIYRLMFATDFPIQSYADSIALVEALKLSTADKEQLYYRNALRLLNLKGELR